MSLVRELVRRNVFRVGVAYLAAAWVVIEGSSLLLDTFSAPEWVLKVIIGLLAIGFPITLGFSWAYEITPEGLKKTADVDRHASITHSTGRRLDEITIGLVVIALTVLVLDRFDLIPGTGTLDPATVKVEEAPAMAGTPAESPPSRFPPHSIAVLPFADMSPEGDQEYFSDGLAEELLNLLAKIPQIQVAARTSAFSFKGTKATIAEVAETLQVAHVLEGSVRKSGNQIRVTAQLIRADSGYHLWSQTWDRDLQDIFAIQDEIAGHVVDELRVTLLGAAPQTRETDPQAYALVLQGRHLREQLTRDSLIEADRLFRKALEIDPEYAAAWVGLGQTFRSQAMRLHVPQHEGFAEALRLADKAIELDPENALALGLRANLAMIWEQDLDAAASLIRKALELAPNDALIFGEAALLASSLGQHEFAVKLYQHQVSLDPVSAIARHNHALALSAVGRFEDSVEEYRTALSLNPDMGCTRYLMGEALLWSGKVEEALSVVLEEADKYCSLIGLAEVYHGQGRPAESDAALNELIEKYEKDAPYNIAQIYAYRGETDLAFEWLERAIEYGDGGLSELSANPGFNGIHDDPRWLPFLERIGKSPEQLAAIEFNIDLPQLQARAD